MSRKRACLDEKSMVAAGRRLWVSGGATTDDVNRWCKYNGLSPTATRWVLAGYDAAKLKELGS